jgi:hypothetical protein
MLVMPVIICCCNHGHVIIVRYAFNNCTWIREDYDSIGLVVRLDQGHFLTVMSLWARPPCTLRRCLVNDGMMKFEVAQSAGLC